MPVAFPTGNDTIIVLQAGLVNARTGRATQYTQPVTSDVRLVCLVNLVQPLATGGHLGPTGEIDTVVSPVHML